MHPYAFCISVTYFLCGKGNGLLCLKQGMFNFNSTFQGGVQYHNLAEELHVQRTLKETTKSM